ncbi:MAG: hypothetical protein Q4C14_08350 [Bacillota bacterium]|nr:hypothetical protein [Bacillota bacterium]
MKEQKNLLYAVYAVLLVLFICLIAFTESRIRATGELLYVYPMGIYILEVILVIGLGAAAGIMFFKKGKGISGRLKINVPKLLIFGLPLLAGSLLKAVYILLPSKDMFPLPEIMANASIIFQLLLGVLIPSCFSRTDE